MLLFLKSEVAESSSKKIAQVDMQSTDLQSQSSHNKMEIGNPRNTVHSPAKPAEDIPTRNEGFPSKYQQVPADPFSHWRYVCT